MASLQAVIIAAIFYFSILGGMIFMTIRALITGRVYSFGPGEGLTLRQKEKLKKKYPNNFDEKTGILTAGETP